MFVTSHSIYHTEVTNGQPPSKVIQPGRKCQVSERKWGNYFFLEMITETPNVDKEHEYEPGPKHKLG